MGWVAERRKRIWDRIEKILKDDPDTEIKSICEELGCGYNTVWRIRKKLNVDKKQRSK